MSLGVCPGMEASAPHLVTDANRGGWSSSWYSLRKRSVRRIVDVSATTGLPDQNGSARAPATLAAPGPYGTVDEGRSSAQTRIRIGHVDRSSLAARQDLADAESLHGDPELVVAARHEEEVLDAERLQFVRDRSGCSGGRGCCYRRRDGRDGIHRDGRGYQQGPPKKLVAHSAGAPSAAC